MRPGDTVHIGFVIGRPSLEPNPVDILVQLEQKTYGDILTLDIIENMNEGKSYEYFAALGTLYPGNLRTTERPYDYAMKLDDDSFLNIPNLLDKLRPLVPRENTWFVWSYKLTAILTRCRVEEIKNCIICSVRAIFCPGIW